MNNYKKGFIAENLAILFLKTRKYQILEKRFKTKLGEIDIICRKEQKIIFIEVKQRKNIKQFEGIINLKQQKRIINASKIYLQKHRLFEHELRFDVIFISLPNYFKHIKHAFYCKY